ncbi:MAG: Sec-independent protein translocase protein TatB [Mizugakiibacter sp.]|uniref:Sec-independent protein translocase protein TatB n=1 Tax=Mizugakiibacter sp. TaxID=1972610 RepID=UPI0031BE160F|nr:Sec-independent protein translocase protein TatB [Xanthomonadaceae bacterium]
MFDVGFGELLLIAVVALVVLGPERLPGTARTLGALLRRARQGWANVQAEVERELELEELKKQARDAATQTQAAAADLRRGLDEAEHSIRKTAETAAAPPADAAPTEKPSTDEPPRSAT